MLVVFVKLSSYLIELLLLLLFPHFLVGVHLVALVQQLLVVLDEEFGAVLILEEGNLVVKDLTLELGWLSFKSAINKESFHVVLNSN